MSTVGLELANFIDPDLTWKTVSKGYRSTSRRSRKPVGRSLKVGTEVADKSPKRMQDTSVSESEKFGVAVLGRRFGDKIEHVPIKKRRYELRSPSPPPRIHSSQPEGYDQPVDSQHALGQRSCSHSTAKRRVTATDKFGHAFNDEAFNGTISEVSNEKLGYSEDFSGIEILADVACNNSMGDDVDNAAEGPAVEEISTADAIDTSTYAMPLKETNGTANFSQKDLVHEDKIDGSPFQDNSAAVLHDLSPNKDNGIVKISVTLQDDRSRWDLNTVMDSWEAPCDDQTFDSQTNVLESISKDGMHTERLENLEGCVVQRDDEDAKYGIESTVQSMVGGVVSGDMHGDMLSNSGRLGNETPKSNDEEHKFEACSGPERTCFEGKCVPTPAEHAPELSALAVANANGSTQVTSMDALCNHSASPGSDHITSTWPSEENIKTGPDSVVVNQNGEDYAAGVQLGKAVCLESVQVEKHDGAFPHAPVSEKTGCEIDNISDKEDEDSGRASVLSDNCDSRISPRKMMSTDTCQPLGHDPLPVENSVSKFDEVGVSHSSPECEDLSASGVSAGEGQQVLTEDAKVQDDQAPVVDTSEVYPPVQVGSNEFLNNSSGHSTAVSGAKNGFAIHDASKSYGDDSANRSGKFDLEDPLDDSYDSDVSQDNRGHIVGWKSDTKLQEGYDSQFEDGELRESVVHCWDENENDDGEVERVDYESDSGDIYDFDAAEYSVSMSGKVEAGVECEKQRSGGSDHIGCVGDKIIMEKSVSDASCQHRLGGFLATNVTDEDFSERGSVKASKLQMRKQFTGKDGTEKIEMDTKVDSGLSGRSDNVNEKIEHSAGGATLEKPSHSVISKTKISGWDRLPEACRSSADMTVELNDGKAVGSKASRREVLSRVEVPSYSDVLHRKDTVLQQQSRSNKLNDSYPRAGRETGSDKSALRMHDRSQGGDHWVDHSVDYWDSKHHHSFSYYGPYDSGNTGPKSVIVNSKGVYRRLIRRSPANMDDGYGNMDMEVAPVRNISPDRSRGRSGRYAPVVGRGLRAPRDGYHGPVPDDTTESSVRIRHYVARRERSFSPIHGRGAPHFSQTRKKSRSRSRTRSPPTWLLPRERNVGLRHLSRSPEFRAEARMERVRLPFQKPGFAADYETGFMSPPRSRFPLQRNSRWIDNRDCAIDHFRDRRSPVRMFRQSQRFDSVGSPGRLKSDEYFRPMMRPGRFPEIAAAGRGRRYDDSDDDRRKQGARYEIIQPVRRYERNGVLRRFQYDAEDGFVAHNSHDDDDFIRGTDRRLRDIPRRAREDKGHLRYNHDKMYNSGPKSFGVREYDEDASPRRRRPS